MKENIQIYIKICLYMYSTFKIKYSYFGKKNAKAAENPLTYVAA